MCHVLIIEDDWLIADHIAQLVEAAGARSVDMADTEDDAVTQALARPPEVIISDVNLQAGGRGPDAVRRIVAALGEMPVMFVTGEPRTFQPHSPAMRVLHKPVDDRTLVATFRAIAPLP
ncbi:DNA-binding response OmpR family regulator [Sphingomonas insulae]|uniref:Response regulator n=1 Tax=Sphingomonas insulae TaxID=424800 RepID=A0ABN1HQ98_9SPHN|nr:response regulator [Sphingomonas insulae]NIJ31375.1 DNA-binding response OmpR family regulator [Sphingomonas insulae]